jgi:hypothetical protein
VGRWPDFFEVKRVNHRWGALHYVLGQEGDPFRHFLDTCSRCHSLVVPPFESDNLEDLMWLSRRRLFGAFSRSKGWRTDRGRRAAQARWTFYDRRIPRWP